MKITELRALRGPNYYSQKPMIYMEVDLEELEERPSDKVSGMKNLMIEMMPSLYEHTCSPGYEGGFFERVTRGTWAGHVAEHIAIELQCLVGDEVSFGKTYSLEEKGKYAVVFRYKNEEVGLLAAKIAVEITKNLFDGSVSNIDEALNMLKNAREESKFGPSTQSIVEAAAKRGIPWYRLNDSSFVQLGQGKYQKKIEATITSNSSYIATEIASDKARTKEILEEHGIPVPKGYRVSNVEELIEKDKIVGAPLVVKPFDGNHGRGITTNINTEDELLEGYLAARKISSEVIVEKFLQGYDYRILLVDGNVVAAALREPAYVVGDGINNIEELINIVNKNPERGEGHEKVLTKIYIDQETERTLSLQGKDLETILDENEKVYVKSTANLSSGGTATDVTDEIHPYNVQIFERTAKIIGLDIIGIDVVSPSLSEPLANGCSGIVEVNAAPGFRMHLKPSKGTKRDVGSAVIDMMFKENERTLLPTCAVTGTNGKTTTTRLISHILKQQGYKVGMTSTDAVTIDGFEILKGDYSGPTGAQSVFKDPTVDCAVLEVARGGILRRGLGFKSCDVGVLLNVSSDHLGYGGINTLEELARLKATVIETVKKDGYAVLNADDSLVMESTCRVKAKKILFSTNQNNAYLKNNKINDGVNVTVVNDMVVIEKKDETIEIAKVKEIPLTFKGTAIFNVENVLASVGACYGLEVDIKNIKEGLMSFKPRADQSSGRMNVIDIGDFKVVVDYGHNVAAIDKTAPFIRSLGCGRLIRMASGVGNRREEDIISYGEAVGRNYDKVVLCDSSPRTRKLRETAALVKIGLKNAGLTDEDITYTDLEKDAVLIALNMGKAGDVIVMQAENIEAVLQDCNSFKKDLEASKEEIKTAIV